MKNATTLVIAAMLTVSTQTIAAEHETRYRCKNGHLVSIGDSKPSITSKCGSPESVTNLVNGFGAHIGQRLRYQDRLDKKWIYLIDIVGGKVVEINKERN